MEPDFEVWPGKSFPVRHCLIFSVHLLGLPLLLLASREADYKYAQKINCNFLFGGGGGAVQAKFQDFSVSRHILLW